MKKKKNYKKQRGTKHWAVNKDVISSPGTAGMSGQATSPLGLPTVWPQLFKMAIIRMTQAR